MARNHHPLTLCDAHAAFSLQVLDSEMVEPFELGEKPSDTAKKIQERAEHLRALFSAMLNYARVIGDDTANNGPVSRALGADLKSTLDSMEDDISDLAGILEKMAEAAAPGGVVEGSERHTQRVRVKELVDAHLPELIGQDHKFLEQWAREHGITHRGMAAFWSEFTVAMFKRVANNDERIAAFSRL